MLKMFLISRKVLQFSKSLTFLTVYWIFQLTIPIQRIFIAIHLNYNYIIFYLITFYVFRWNTFSVILVDQRPWIEYLATVAFLLDNTKRCNSWRLISTVSSYVTDCHGQSATSFHQFILIIDYHMLHHRLCSNIDNNNLAQRIRRLFCDVDYEAGGRGGRW